MTRAKLIIDGILLAIVLAIAFAAYHYRSEFHAEQKRADTAEHALKSAAKTISLFNDISKANTDEHQKNNSESETRVVYIKEQVKGDECTDKPVPYAATDSLRQHAERIRTGSTSTAE